MLICNIMDYRLLALLTIISHAVSESPFACENSTVYPMNGLPFYEIILTAMTHKEALATCREKNADLLTIGPEEFILTDPESIWLAARRRDWIHQDRDLALTYELNVDDAQQTGCVIASSSGELQPVDCLSQHNIVCQSENLVDCDVTNIYEFWCYFLPKGFEQGTYKNAADACHSNEAIMVIMSSPEQLQWISDALSTTDFWLGYSYYNGGGSFYWTNGSYMSVLPAEGNGDCLIINSTGGWEYFDCDQKLEFACTLTVPYLEKSAECQFTANECNCYWKCEEEATFDEAMQNCLSSGGTLFYPNKEEKITTHFENVWVGISGGHTPGVFRGVDSSAITWAAWANEDEVNLGQCVYLSNGLFSTDTCNSTRSYVCQDETIYPCSEDSGCLRALAAVFWKVDEGEEFNVVETVNLRVTGVTSLELCWDLCVNYIGFVCLTVMYNTTTKECELSSELATSASSTTDERQIRRRSRISLDTNPFCLYNAGMAESLSTATNLCSEQGPIWTIPTILDPEMEALALRESSQFWVSACESATIGVYKTLEDAYIPYSNLSSYSKPAGCIIAAERWKTVECSATENTTALCFAFLEDLCNNITIPENASLEVRNSSVFYTCNDNYFIPNVQNTTIEFQCSCSIEEDLNSNKCVEILCPDVEPIANASVTVHGTRIGDTATVKCNTNFLINDSLTDTKNITCIRNENGVIAFWDEIPSCTLALCSDPEPVEYATLVVHGMVIGDNVTVVCNSGFRISNLQTNTKNITCVSSNSEMGLYWDDIPTCERMLCDPPVEVDKASIISTSPNIDDVTVYNCDAGYKVVGVTPATIRFETTCVFTESTWTVSWTQPLGCEDWLCPEPPPVQHSMVIVNEYYIGAKALYICNVQYSIQNESSSQATCITDPDDPDLAIWHPLPTCTYDANAPLIRQCPTPQTVPWTTSQLDGQAFGSVSVYNAFSGYAFELGGRCRTSVCRRTGDWSIDVPSPKRLTCPKLPDIVGTSKSTENTDEGTEVKIRCNDPTAKMKNGLPIVITRCTNARRWTFIPTACDVNRCGPFTLVKNARLVDFNNTVGGLTTIKCETSYRFIDGHQTKSFQCLEDLTWQPVGPCLLNTCNFLRVPDNGTLSTNIAIEGTLVEVSCLPGYMFPDRNRSKIMVCDSTFQWNDTVDDCVVLHCPAPPEITNGEMSLLDTLYNTNITYRCQAGYRLEFGSTEVTIRCEEDGQWTYNTLSCEAGRCPPVPEVTNAVANTSLALNGTVVSYTCRLGFVFPSHSTVTYGSCDGVQWTINETVCNEVTCLDVSLPHATWTTSGRQYGDTVVFNCDEGYIAESSITGVLRCEANSQWSGAVQGCEPVFCGFPPIVEHSTRDVAPYVYGTIINYRCLTDYWFERGVTNISTSCTRYGVWSSIPTACVPITCPPIPVWNDIEVNTTDNVPGTTVNVSCLRDEDSQRHYSISYCTPVGEWVPPLDSCQIDQVVFQPEPEEAEGSGEIGVVIISCIGIIYGAVFISDIPKLLATLRGL